MGSQLSTRFNNGNQISNSTTNKREYFTENLIFKIMNRGKEDINFPGDHETYVSDGSEGQLHNEDCEKNPGHIKFIPVDTFTLEHLPEGQRDTDLYETIKAAADLTVKVNVPMTSPHRPEFWPKTDVPYPYYNTTEQKDRRTGSGMIYRVLKFRDRVPQDGDTILSNFTKCWCRKCEHSDSPSNVWWEFEVFTATHLVFDDIEASHTTLTLFYDNKDSPVVIVDKVSVNCVSIDRDWCRLECVTCDENLGNKLKEMWKHYLAVWYKVCNKYKKSNSVDKLTFIVSHPHGCFKQVSVGQWMKKYKVSKNKKMYTYTTCTCPGSSGAKVFFVGDRDRRWRVRLFDPGHVHSGTIPLCKYNYSGVW